MTRTLTATVMTACAVLLATPSLAVDGEVLINQARVNAGGITPGDTAGFPATISRAGRYKLAGNLNPPAGINAIEVMAGDVTIDLNGFTINGGGDAASGIVALTGGGMLRVANGTVTGFTGAGVTKSPGRAVIENMRIVSNIRNLELPAESHVRDSTIANGGAGDFVLGIRCYGRCLIENNIITGNTGSGIQLEAGGGTVLGNVIAGNGGGGLLSSDNRTGYGDNVLVGNNGGGAQVSGLVYQLHPNVCDPACP